MDYTVIGGTVNLASRLENQATPGGVLISFETLALVKDDVYCDERGYVQVKGIAQPVSNKRACRICGLSSMPTACPMTS